MQNNGSSIWWCETFILDLIRDDEASRHQHQPSNQPCYRPGEVRKCTDYSGEEEKEATSLFHKLAHSNFSSSWGARKTMFINMLILFYYLLQPQGELYPIQTIFNHRSRDQLLEIRTIFYETIISEFLVQGNFKHTQFSREHWDWLDSNTQPLAPKASAVSIELTWLNHSLYPKAQADAPGHLLWVWLFYR